MSASLTFTRLLSAAPAEVFRAFTHATALRDWLADDAYAEARLGGALFLSWRDGYLLSSRFTRFEPERALAFDWNSPSEPGPMPVEIVIEPAPEGARLTVTQAGLGEGPAWEGARAMLPAAWAAGLENLQSHLESGIDLRQARRPRMGIAMDPMNAAAALRLGTPVNTGVLLVATAEGSGARAAGLQKDDVLVALNGVEIVTPDSLTVALEELKAGDSPLIEFYRGAQKHSVPLTLSAFPIPAAPESVIELASRVEDANRQMQSDLRAILAGVTEAEASHAPAEGEWNLHQIVAHFILCERDYQSWLADMLNDTPIKDYLEYRTNVTPRLNALARRCGSLEALLQETEKAQAETVDLLAQLPAEFLRNRKHLYRRAALWALETVPEHYFGEHKEQILNTLAAAR